MEVDIRRELNAKRMNALLNFPEVRPWVADMGEGVLDISAIVENRRNFLLMGPHGGILFGCLLPGIYEAHTVVHPAGRGEWTKAMIQAALHYMFTRTDAFEIITRVPMGHVAAMAAALGAGMRMELTVPDAVRFRGEIKDIHILSFRIQDWMPSAPGLVERGRWLHKRLHEEALRLGITEPAHDDDDLHNRYVGGCIDMVFGGQTAKGVLLYNRWARMCRHATVEAVTQTHIRFDIGVLEFKGDDIEVIPDAVPS